MYALPDDESSKASHIIKSESFLAPSVCRALDTLLDL